MKRNFIALAALLAGLVIGALLAVQFIDRPAAINAGEERAAPVPISYKMPHIKRPNLLVQDLDRSLVVYRDILGLGASSPSVSGPDSFSYPVFNIPKGTPMRSLTLHEDSEQRVMALTELKGFDLPRPVSTPYLSAVVIGVEDLKGKFEDLEALGLTVTESRIADGADFSFIEQAFVDPDGHLIVCYEVLSM